MSHDYWLEYFLNLILSTKEGEVEFLVVQIDRSDLSRSTNVSIGSKLYNMLCYLRYR